MHCAAFAAGSNRNSLVAAYRFIDFEFPRPSGLERCIRTLPLYAVLIVMSDVSEDEVTSLSVLARFTQLPVILCGEFSPAFSSLVAVLGKRNPKVILKRYDDVNRVGRFVRSHSPAKEQLQFRTMIEPNVQSLPARMQFALDHILRELPIPGAVGRFAEASGLTVHSTGDHMRAAGFANAHSVFRTSRLLDACLFARDPAYRGTDLACKTGYKRADGLLRALAPWGIKRLADIPSLNSEEILTKAATDVFHQ